MPGPQKSLPHEFREGILSALSQVSDQPYFIAVALQLIQVNIYDDAVFVNLSEIVQPTNCNLSAFV